MFSFLIIMAIFKKVLNIRNFSLAMVMLFFSCAAASGVNLYEKNYIRLYITSGRDNKDQMNRLLGAIKALSLDEKVNKDYPAASSMVMLPRRDFIIMALAPMLFPSSQVTHDTKVVTSDASRQSIMPMLESAMVPLGFDHKDIQNFATIFNNDIFPGRDLENRRKELSAIIQMNTGEKRETKLLNFFGSLIKLTKDRVFKNSEKSLLVKLCIIPIFPEELRNRLKDIGSLSATEKEAVNKIFYSATCLPYSLFGNLIYTCIEMPEGMKIRYGASHKHFFSFVELNGEDDILLTDFMLGIVWHLRLSKLTDEKGSYFVLKEKMRIDPFNFYDLSGQKLVPLLIYFNHQIENGALKLNELRDSISRYNLNTEEAERLIFNVVYPSLRKTEGVGILSALERNIGELYAHFDAVRYKEDELAAYEKAIKIDPNNAEAFFNRGVAFLEANHRASKEGDSKKAINYRAQAIDSFGEALRLNPGYAEAYFQLGTMYEEQKNYQDAITMYEQAVSFNPCNCKALFNLGNVYARKEGSIDNYRTIEAWAKAVFIDQGRQGLMDHIPQAVRQKVNDKIKEFTRKVGWRPVSIYSYNIIGSAI